MDGLIWMTDYSKKLNFLKKHLIAQCRERAIKSSMLKGKKNVYIDIAWPSNLEWVERHEVVWVLIISIDIFSFTCFTLSFKCHSSSYL